MDFLTGYRDFVPFVVLGRAWLVPSSPLCLLGRGPVLVLLAAFAFRLGRWLLVPGVSNNFGRLVSCVRLLCISFLSAGIPSPLVFTSISGHIDKYES